MERIVCFGIVVVIVAAPIVVVGCFAIVLWLVGTTQILGGK